MPGTDGADGGRGSAVVLAMLLLVLLSAVGMYAVSLPVSVAESALQRHQSFAAKNMARAGAHAAIARLPGVSPEAAPYVRRIPIGPKMTGRYAVTSRRTGRGDGAGGSGRGPAFEDYALVSEGTVSGAFGGTFRVRADVRLSRLPAPAPRARILKWEESGPR